MKHTRLDNSTTHTSANEVNETRDFEHMFSPPSYDEIINITTRPTQVKVRKCIPRSIFIIFFMFTVMGGVELGLSINRVYNNTAHYYPDGTMYLSGVYLRSPWSSKVKTVVSTNPQTLILQNLSSVLKLRTAKIKLVSVTYSINDVKRYINKIIEYGGVNAYKTLIKVEIENVLIRSIRQLKQGKLEIQAIKRDLLKNHKYLDIDSVSFTEPKYVLNH